MNGIRKKVTPRDSRGLITLEIKIDRKRERERERGNNWQRMLEMELSGRGWKRKTREKMAGREDSLRNCRGGRRAA